MKWILALMFLSSAPVVAKKKHQHTKAHVHGDGRIDLAFENREGRMEIEVPVASLLSFEHEPKSDDEKKQQKQVLEIFENKITEIVRTDVSWSCVINTEKVEIKGEREHRDLRASYLLQCPALSSGMVEFNIQSKFPSWKNVEVQLIAAKTQTKKVIQKSGTRLEIK